MINLDINEMLKLRNMLDRKKIKYGFESSDEGVCLTLFGLKNEEIGKVNLSLNSIGGTMGFLEVDGLGFESPVGWQTGREIFDYYIMYVLKCKASS